MLDKPPLVRMATPADNDALFDILMALNRDNSFGVPVSDVKVLTQIRHGTENKGGMIGVIDGASGSIDASIGLYLSQWWYSDNWHLSEVWLFVRPEARGKGYEKLLFQFAEWCRDKMAEGSDQEWVLVTSVSSRKRLAAKLRLWGRYASQVGGIFVMEESPRDHRVKNPVSLI